MDAAKRKRLKAKGWRLGDADDFLNLDQAEAELVELRVRLARAFVDARQHQHYTQVQVAKLLGSSQSRIAKLENADPTVSIDLFVRSLLSLGKRGDDIAKAIGGKRASGKARSRRNSSHAAA